jgi:hypothetical protein
MHRPASSHLILQRALHVDGGTNPSESHAQHNITFSNLFRIINNLYWSKDFTKNERKPQ